MSDTKGSPAIGWDANGQRSGSVAIVAMGYSHNEYVNSISQMGSRQAFADQTWLVNSMGMSLQGDMLFMMDDLDHAMTLGSYDHEGKHVPDVPDVRVMALRKWIENAPIPVMTSRKHDYAPTAIEYPLGDVIASVGSRWFNNTLPYAVSFANHIGVAEVKMYGCDYYSREAANKSDKDFGHALAIENAAWEKGMACLVHHLTLFLRDGGKISIAGSSVLMDMGTDQFDQFYGYGKLQPALRDVDGKLEHYFPHLEPQPEPPSPEPQPEPEPEPLQAQAAE